MTPVTVTALAGKRSDGKREGNSTVTRRSAMGNHLCMILCITMTYCLKMANNYGVNSRTGPSLGRNTHKITQISKPWSPTSDSDSTLKE